MSRHVALLLSATHFATVRLEPCSSGSSGRFFRCVTTRGFDEGSLTVEDSFRLPDRPLHVMQACGGVTRNMTTGFQGGSELVQQQPRRDRISRIPFDSAHATRDLLRQRTEARKAAQSSHAVGDGGAGDSRSQRLAADGIEQACETVDAAIE